MGAAVDDGEPPDRRARRGCVDGVQVDQDHGRADVGVARLGRSTAGLLAPPPTDGASPGPGVVRAGHAPVLATRPHGCADEAQV